jgi:uncharacterized protein (TIGR02001 family)
MHRKLIALATGSLLAGFSGLASAEFETSANVALTTDYVWRGVSQTDNGPAIQGGFDLAHSSGVYAGIWGSNVEFGDDANIELDYYGGYATEFGNGLGLDVGIIYYDYPSESDLDFEELYVGLGYGIVSGKISYDFDNDNGYYEAGADFELPAGFGLGLHVGYFDFDEGDSATDWKIGVSKSIGGFDMELAYTDTDIDDNDLADGRAIFTVSKSF